MFAFKTTLKLSAFLVAGSLVAGAIGAVIVLLYWAGFIFVLFLLVLGIRSVFRFADGCKDGMRRLTEAIVEPLGFAAGGDKHELVRIPPVIAEPHLGFSPNEWSPIWGLVQTNERLN